MEVSRQGFSLSEQTVADRMAAWGVDESVASLPMAEVVRVDGRTANQLIWLLRKHRGKA